MTPASWSVAMKLRTCTAGIQNRSALAAVGGKQEGPRHHERAVMQQVAQHAFASRLLLVCGALQAVMFTGNDQHE